MFYQLKNVSLAETIMSERLSYTKQNELFKTITKVLWKSIGYTVGHGKN